MVAGLLVEDLAEGLLVRLGYVIKERRKKIVFEGVEVAEIDYLAEKEGEKYIVEVKAGRISVNDVRQVYTNSVLVNARPMIIARGYSNASAKVTAEKLGVEVLILDEYLEIVSIDELSAILESVVLSTLSKLLLAGSSLPENIDEEALSAIASSKTYEELKAKLKNPNKIISEFRKLGVFTLSGDFNVLRVQAEIALQKLRLFKIEKRLKEMEEKIS
ncbi:MAG: hypothetical protein DRJ55_01380 [Thermoprotei archaeon]|nr:MAG: hypothetical protein DRJ55_01380 [Thermoprotei archaeon]